MAYCVRIVQQKPTDALWCAIVDEREPGSVALIHGWLNVRGIHRKRACRRWTADNQRYVGWVGDAIRILVEWEGCLEAVRVSHQRSSPVIVRCRGGDCGRDWTSIRKKKWILGTGGDLRLRQHRKQQNQHSRQIGNGFSHFWITPFW